MISIELPRFRGSRAAPDGPTLYYVNGANGSPVITAVNVAVLAEISQIAVLGIFYAEDGAAGATDVLPGVSSGPAVETLKQVDEALEAGADILLLDNMPTDVIREAVRRSRGRAKTEISGGVTLNRMPELAATGADFVSSGALTHSAPAIDISFEIEPA